MFFVISVSLPSTLCFEPLVAVFGFVEMDFGDVDARIQSSVSEELSSIERVLTLLDECKNNSTRHFEPSSLRLFSRRHSLLSTTINMLNPDGNSVLCLSHRFVK